MFKCIRFLYYPLLCKPFDKTQQQLERTLQKFLRAISWFILQPIFPNSVHTPTNLYAYPHTQTAWSTRNLLIPSQPDMMFNEYNAAHKYDNSNSKFIIIEKSMQCLHDKMQTKQIIHTYLQAEAMCLAWWRFANVILRLSCLRNVKPAPKCG